MNESEGDLTNEKVLLLVESNCLHPLSSFVS